MDTIYNYLIVVLHVYHTKKTPHLWGWYNRECVHDSVWVLFTDLGDEECSHTRSGTATEGVGQLESLKTIAALGFLPDNIKDGVDEFSAFCVVTLGPVVASAALTEHKVVWTENLTEWTGSDGVHGSGLQVYENGTGYIFASCGFIVVDIDSLQLKVGVTVVGTGGVNAVLV